MVNIDWHVYHDRRIFRITKCGKDVASKSIREIAKKMGAEQCDGNEVQVYKTGSYITLRVDENDASDSVLLKSLMELWDRACTVVKKTIIISEDTGGYHVIEGCD